jgi:hypothetical protein
VPQLTAERVRDYLAAAPAQVRDRVAATARTTPGRLALYLAAIVVLGVLAGVTAVVGVVSRSGAVDAVGHGSGPLAVQAQQLYRSLSDADATAAAAFLTSGAEPPELRQRYLDDIAGASAALAASVSSAAERTQVGQVAAALPVYTGLVETARTLNRLNNPLGAAYLREASALMRGTLLPAADELYRAATARLAADRSDAAGFPWWTILFTLAALGMLGVTQVYLGRRTQRLVNTGLLGASLAAVVLLLWAFGGWIGVSVDLHRADVNGSAQVQALAQARILALQARADEALTLVARGSGGAFETDFTDKMTALADPGGALDKATTLASDPAVRGALAQARTALDAWRTGHAAVRKADDGGDYPGAVAIAVTDPTKNSADFAALDSALQQAIDVTGRAFDAAAADAGTGLTAAAVLWTVLALGIVAGAVVGIQQRIAEYR